MEVSRRLVDASRRRMTGAMLRNPQDRQLFDLQRQIDADSAARSLISSPFRSAAFTSAAADSSATSHCHRACTNPPVAVVVTCGVVSSGPESLSGRMVSMTAALADMLPVLGQSILQPWQWIAIVALIVLIVVWVMLRRKQ